MDVNKILAGEGNVSFNGWFADFLAPAGFLVATDNCLENKTVAPPSTLGATCVPAIHHEFVRARDQQTADPEQATLLWRKVDRDTTDAAPWVAYLNPGKLELLSSRVGNYEYSPQWGTLFDQLWVR